MPGIEYYNHAASGTEPPGVAPYPERIYDEPEYDDEGRLIEYDSNGNKYVRNEFGNILWLWRCDQGHILFCHRHMDWQHHLITFLRTHLLDNGHDISPRFSFSMRFP